MTRTPDCGRSSPSTPRRSAPPPAGPSPATALGAVMATKACAERVWGTPSLQGRRVALQGLGAVGSKALALLLAEGAEVVVADPDEQKVAWAKDTHAVAAVEPEEVYRQDADIFAPY